MTKNMNGIWTEKYRAKRLEDLIVPEAVMNIGSRMIKTGKAQNILLHGSYGIGKTSFAGIIIKELNLEELSPKSRMQNDIRDLYSLSSRTSVLGSKYVAFIDEADQLRSPVQKEMLRYMEGTGTAIQATILIANDLGEIHEGVKSRVKELDFNWPEKEQEGLLEKLKHRLQFILNNEGVRFSVYDVDSYIDKFFRESGDVRKLINEIQGNVAWTEDGKIELMPCL